MEFINSNMNTIINGEEENFITRILCFCLLLSRSRLRWLDRLGIILGTFLRVKKIFIKTPQGRHRCLIKLEQNKIE